MNNVFMQRLQTPLYFCKIVGCVQFTLEKNPSLRDNIVALICPLPFNIISTYFIFVTFKNLDMLISYDKKGEIIQITNFLTLLSTSLMFYLRTGYYFLRRKHIKNIIFEVSNYN